MTGTTSLPAFVTIPGLPTGTTVTGAELIEAAQVVGGTTISVQLPLTAIMTTTLGALPVGGGTGQVLNKASGTSFATQWSNISSLVTASSGITVAGSTTVQVSLSSAAGLSVLGVAGTTAAVPAAIAGTADQVLVINHAGTGVVFGPLNLAATAAFTGTLGVPGGGTGTTTLTARGVVVGAGTAALQVAVPATAGNLLIDQGTSANPAFTVVAGDVTISASGTTTIAANAVSNAKLAQGPATSLLGNNTAATANRSDLNVAQIVQMLGLQPQPGGRLTVTNGVPVMAASAVAQTTLYYAPFVNPFVPINNATSTQYYFFPANATATTGLSLTLGTNWLTGTLYDTFAIASSNLTTPILASVAWSNATTRATALNQFSGLQSNGATATMRTSNSTTVSVPIYQGTYLGTFLTSANTAGNVDWLPGAIGTGTQQAGRLSIWNAYNGVDTRGQLTDNTGSWTYTAATARVANNNPSNAITFVSGLANDCIDACYVNDFGATAVVGAQVTIGVALDTTSASGLLSSYFGDNPSTATLFFAAPVPVFISPQLGQHVVYAFEASDGTHTATFFGGTTASPPAGFPQMILSMKMKM